MYPDFHLPTKIYAQSNIINHIGEIISSSGANRALIITSSDDYEKFETTIENIVDNLNKNDVITIIYDEIPGKTNNEYIDSAVYYAKKTQTDIIIGLGRIESINAAKAIAILANNFYFCEDIFEYPKTDKPMPLALVPFIPSFGLEILPCFFIPDIHENIKRIYYNFQLYPELTIIDPNLAIMADDDETARASIAALALSVESLISNKSSEFSNTYALKSIDLTFQNLVNSFREPDNAEYRLPLSLASLLSGIAVSTAFMSVAFSLSLSLSSLSSIPLSISIGILLPHIMEYNLTTPKSTDKYIQIAKVMDEDVRGISRIEAAIKAIEAIRKVGTDIDIPQRLSDFEISKTIFNKVSEIALSYPFIKHSPRILTQDELETILIAAF
jgi:alcohol dehydrogenase class IV